MLRAAVDLEWSGAPGRTTGMAAAGLSRGGPGLQRPGQARAESAPWQRCCIVLAFCDMRTLYLRNVPDQVVESLEQLAKRESMSVNAFAVRELTQLSRRADNRAILEALPDLGISSEETVRWIEEGRAER